VTYTLGEVRLNDYDPQVQAWTAAVESRGNVTTLMPAGAFKGEPAEKIVMPRGVYLPPAIYYKNFWYSPASANIRARYRANANANARALSTQATIDRLSTVPQETLAQAGKLARTGVSAITGIPTWAIPVLLIGGGAFVLMSAAHSFLPDRR
jgi:hypothetical protein